MTLEQKKTFRKKCKSFILIGDLLCFIREDGNHVRAVFDFEVETVKIILDEEHGCGHPGMTKMIDLIHRKYYGISSEVIKNYVKACDVCTRFNTLTTIQDIQVNEITQKYDRYIIDCIDLRNYRDQNDGFC